MAAEVAPENLVDATPRADDEPNPQPNLSDDALVPEPPRVNGDTDHDDLKPELEPVDAATSADVSVSGGSDSEAASKTDASKAHGSSDEKGHLRTLSGPKKAFKSVSVNKKFLAAKAAATAAAPSKLGDKPVAGGISTPATSSTSSTPRPRLVAKTGSSLRDASPRTAGAANGGQPAAPDASAVWNKNRPAPPPEPKKFTDEELKEQYGIHLASRLQTDESRQGNWADIDDDDDDWAPETIEWTDGTKITLPTAEEAAAAAQEAEREKAEPPKAMSPAPSTTRLGTGRGLVLKGVPEKPTLVAKPPGPPAPVKSPWATLPPVEKVSPAPLEAPHAGHQSRFAPRDPYGFDGMPSMPTREIPADDFVRWREGGPQSRELFNSQSGRYEPAPDGRRGSARGPAVLQRMHDPQGPAEPSAAFQTHRTSQDAPWQRRRTSSNVSGGSGSFGRRLSRGPLDMPTPEVLNARRPSLAAVSDTPASPTATVPRGAGPGSWQRTSPAISHASPASVHSQMAPRSDSRASAVPPVPPPAAQAVNYLEELELQKKIMKERREEAKKRRVEEEAREEAAKQERIRAKLEALGPPPESAKARKENLAKDEKAENKAVPSATQDGVPSILPPKPTLPENAGETTQYGMMKVHHPESAKVLAAEGKTEGEAEAKTESTTEPSHEPHANGDDAEAPPSKEQTQPADVSADERPKSWQATSSGDRFSGWGPLAHSKAGGSVWGPPSNDRSLGNGTFNPELSRMPDMRNQPAHGPGPIGPPGAPNGQFPRGREPYPGRPAPIAPPHRPDERQKMGQHWQSKILQQDADLRKQADASRTQNASQPTFKETFHEVMVDAQGHRVDAQKPEQAETVPGQTWDARRSHPADGDNSRFQDPWRSRQPDVKPVLNAGPQATSSPPVRQSKWFPARDIRLEEQTAPIPRPNSPSPPPPTMAGHPAYDGDISHPHVSLPRPSPVVRLPPAPWQEPRPAPSFAAAAAPHAGTAPVLPKQDLRAPRPIQAQTTGDWQDRINNLIGRKTTTPHAESNKVALDHPKPQTIPVSLPTVAEKLPVHDNVTMSRPMAEECFEEQEMGSLPVIRVPNKAPEAAWNLAPAQTKPLPRRFIISQPATIDSSVFTSRILESGNTVVIMLPGMAESKTARLPPKMDRRQKSNPRRGGSARGGSRHASASHPRTPKTPHSDANSVTSNHSHSGRGSNSGSGTHRSRGGVHSSPWQSRHVSTPATAV